MWQETRIEDEVGLVHTSYLGSSSLAWTLRSVWRPGSVRTDLIVPVDSDVLESGPGVGFRLSATWIVETGGEWEGITYRRRACSGPFDLPCIEAW